MTGVWLTDKPGEGPHPPHTSCLDTIVCQIPTELVWGLNLGSAEEEASYRLAEKSSSKDSSS